MQYNNSKGIGAVLSFFDRRVPKGNLKDRMKVFVLQLLLLGAASSWPVHPTSCWSNVSGTGGDDCLHRHNTNPGVVPNITVFTGAPVFVRAVKNGKLYRGGGNGDDAFHIVHLWSSSNSSSDNFFEMGEAYGALLPDEFRNMFTRVLPWLTQMLEKAVPWLPKVLADLIVE